MKAHLRSARIAPKKANIIAKMVRGMSVSEAMHALKHTHKKGARMVEELLKSAVANAQHNDKQNAEHLVIKTIVVNQGLGYRRGIPKARGSVRPITKFLSHISLTLGVAGAEDKKVSKKEKMEKKTVKDTKASQTAKNTVKKAPTGTKQATATTESSSSESSSTSSAS